MFDKQNKLSLNNAISYVAPKNNATKNIKSLNSRVSCVVGISILEFDKYCQTVFDFMELNISPTFKKFLQSERINANKKV